MLPRVVMGSFLPIIPGSIISKDKAIRCVEWPEIQKRKAEWKDEEKSSSFYFTFKISSQEVV